MRPPANDDLVDGVDFEALGFPTAAEMVAEMMGPRGCPYPLASEEGTAWLKGFAWAMNYAARALQ